MGLLLYTALQRTWFFSTDSLEFFWKQVSHSQCSLLEKLPFPYKSLTSHQAYKSKCIMNNERGYTAGMKIPNDFKDLETIVKSYLHIIGNDKNFHWNSNSGFLSQSTQFSSLILHLRAFAWGSGLRFPGTHLFLSLYSPPGISTGAQC